MDRSLTDVLASTQDLCMTAVNARYTHSLALISNASVQRRACIARAAAAPPTPAQPYSDVALLPAEERAKLARQWGFDYIGKELPDDVRLKDIVKTLPKEVFEINNARGWLTCLTSLITFPLSLYLVHITPAALLPISWAIAGTAFTGWFVIGHDCGHRTFNTNKVQPLLTTSSHAYPISLHQASLSFKGVPGCVFSTGCVFSSTRQLRS